MVTLENSCATTNKGEVEKDDTAVIEKGLWFMIYIFFNFSDVEKNE